MSSLQRAIVLAARADTEELRCAYWCAVADGALNTQCCADCERSHGALRLLTLAILRLPDLSVQSHLLDAGDSDGLLDILHDAVSDTCAGALRLAHRALEAHASDSATTRSPGSSTPSSAPARSCVHSSRH